MNSREKPYAYHSMVNEGERKELSIKGIHRVFPKVSQYADEFKNCATLFSNRLPVNHHSHNITAKCKGETYFTKRIIVGMYSVYPATCMVSSLNEWNNEIQRAMAHPVKRRIIELLRDANLSFTELFNAAGNSGNHGKFGYHLRTLKGFVEFEQSTQKYQLTRRGRLLDTVIRDFRFITQTSKRKLMKYVQTLEFGDHTIGFYDNDYLKRMMSFPFIKARLENHEAVYYVIAEHTLDSECQEIKSYGIDVESFPKGALTVMLADEWFLNHQGHSF